jgi:xanthine dehydrogenase YagT iron-sulfur-binding subunit
VEAVNEPTEDHPLIPLNDVSGDRTYTWTRRETLQLTGGAVTLALAGLPAGTAATQPSQAVGTSTIDLTVNGRPQRLDLDPRTSLLDLLREDLQLSGTKKGCNQGACGACTILLDGKRINACLTLAIMHDGAEITTIEGLATGETLHPLQAAFIEQDAFQCGYCTPGQIVSGVACIAEGHAGSPDEIRAWMSGNICRCGAYPNIVGAIAEAAKEA